MPKEESTTNHLTDWYKRVPASLLPKYHNPGIKKHGLKLPFRGLLVGGSGSGKSTLVLEIIKRCNKTFQLIVLCVKNSDEPLYNLLKSKTKPEQLMVYENGEIPEIGEFEALKNEQVLMVFDDLMNTKEAHQPIIEFYLRGRKLAGGISMLFLTQSFFKCPKSIRLNCNYIILLKLSSMKDLSEILKDFNLGVNPKELLQMYKVATKEPKNFLMVDVDADPEKRFRHNFLKILTPAPPSKK